MKKRMQILLYVFFQVLLISCNNTKTIEQIIFEKIERNDLQAIKKIFKNNNIDINKENVNRSNETYLYFAVEKQQYETVEWFIENGADINKPSNKGTPLEKAAYKDDLKMVKLLIAHGADINSTARYGGLSGGGSAILTAIIHVNYEMVDYLLSRNADINKGTGLEGEGAALFLFDQMHSKFSAKQYDDYYKMLEYIFAKGFDVNQTAYYGNILSEAIAREDLRVIKLLLQHNVDLNCFIEDLNMTCIQYAYEKNNQEVISLLHGK